MRTVQRAAAGTAAVCALGLSLALGLPAMAAASSLASRILVGGPPFSDSPEGDVSANATLTVTVMVEDIDDPAAPGGTVDVKIDLTEVASQVVVVGLGSGCSQATQMLTCSATLPTGAATPVPVPPWTIQLRAASGAPVGPAGDIYLDWYLNQVPATTMAEIHVVVKPAVTPTTTTEPLPSTTTTYRPPTIRPPTTSTTTTPAHRPSPSRSATDTPSPSPTPMPDVTMTPEASQENPGGGDPLAGGPPQPIPFATPAGDSTAWRSPALVLSLGTAAAGLLIALAYALISLRRAGRS